MLLKINKEKDKINETVKKRKRDLIMDAINMRAQSARDFFRKIDRTIKDKWNFCQI